MRNTTLHISNKVTKTINMMKKLSLLFLFITFLCGTSAYAAPVEGKTFTNVDHLGAYPTPQNMTASLSGNQIVLQWDGVHWPADGYPEEIDGRTVPTNVYYAVDCRTRCILTTNTSFLIVTTGEAMLSRSASYRIV